MRQPAFRRQVDLARASDPSTRLLIECRRCEKEATSPRLRVPKITAAYGHVNCQTLAYRQRLLRAPDGCATNGKTARRPDVRWERDVGSGDAPASEMKPPPVPLDTVISSRGTAALSRRRQLRCGFRRDLFGRLGEGSAIVTLGTGVPHLVAGSGDAAVTLVRGEVCAAATAFAVKRVHDGSREAIGAGRPRASPCRAGRAAERSRGAWCCRNRPVSSSEPPVR